MVHPHLSFETVLGLAVRAHHDPGVVDQTVQSLETGRQSFGKVLYRSEAGQIQHLEFHLGVRESGGHFRLGDGTLFGVSTGHDHRRAGSGAHFHRLQAETGIRSGDDKRLLWLRSFSPSRPGMPRSRQ